MTTKTFLTDKEMIELGIQSHAMEPGENGYILPVAQKGDMRLKDGKLWVCSDPDIDRWVCPDDRGWQLVPIEPTDEMTQAGVNLALSARISGAYPWPTYIRDMYKTMLSAAPKFGEEE